MTESQIMLHIMPDTELKKNWKDNISTADKTTASSPTATSPRGWCSE